MKNQVNGIIFALLCATALLQGSSTQNSNNVSLQITDYAQDPGQVLVHATVPITAGMIMSKGIQPIKISITNNQARPIVLTKDSLKVSLSDPYYLSRQFHSLNQFTSSNFFDWMWISLLINFGWVAITSWTVLLPMATAFTLGWFPGGMVAFVYWWKTGNKNKAMTAAFLRDLMVFADKARVVIYPGQTIQRILLFPKGAVDACTLRIFNAVGSEVVAGFSIYMTV